MNNKRVKELKNKIILEAEGCFNNKFKLKINHYLSGDNLLKPKSIALISEDNKTLINYDFYKNNGNEELINLNNYFFKFFKQNIERNYIIGEQLSKFRKEIKLINDFFMLIKKLNNISDKITLKELRKEKGLTQQELANELGTSLRTIQHWENIGIANKMTQKLISLYFSVPEKLIQFDISKDFGFKNKYIFGDNRFEYTFKHLESWLPFFDKCLISIDNKDGINVFKKYNFSNKVILCKGHNKEINTIINDKNINSILLIDECENVNSDYLVQLINKKKRFKEVELFSTNDFKTYGQGEYSLKYKEIINTNKIN